MRLPNVSSVNRPLSPQSPLHLVRTNARPHTPLDEAELVSGVLRGDAIAAGALWDVYMPLVRGLMAKTLGSRCEVDDGVQDVFLKVFKGLPRLRQVESLRSYIVATTLTTVRSELRKRRLRRLFGFETQWQELPEVAIAPVDLGMRNALRRLEEALDELTPDDRMAFCLRYVEAMELTEVAAATGWSLASTKRYLARAKKRLWVLVHRDPELAPYLNHAAGHAEEESQ